MLPFILLAGYGGGAWYTAKRVDRAYTGSGKWAVVALWPVLMVSSKRFRQNLRR